MRWVEERTDGVLTLRVGMEGERVRLEWPAEASLERVDGTWTAWVDPAVAPARAEKLRSGAMLAARRYLEGEVTLHASAASVGARALVAVGPSGAGKSTLAAELCARGHSLLADDLLAVERGGNELFALPTERAHWLVATDGTKAPLVPRSVAGGVRTKVAAIVVLEHADVNAHATPRQLNGRHAMLALSSAQVTLPIATRAERVRDFEWLAGVCATVPIYVVSRRCAPTRSALASIVERLIEP